MAVDVIGTGAGHSGLPACTLARLHIRGKRREAPRGLPVDRHEFEVLPVAQLSCDRPEAGAEQGRVELRKEAAERVVAGHSVRESAAVPSQPFQVETDELGEEPVAVEAADHRDEEPRRACRARRA